MTFSLVITDLHLDVAALLATRRDLPALPALGRLLAGSVAHRMDSGWRQGMLNEMEWTAAQGLAPATIAAWALQPATTGPAVSFAHAVHQVAGMSRVHLHPAGLLRLDESEMRQLCESFDRELGTDSLRLRHAGSGMLITGDLGAAQDNTEAQEPARYLGSELTSSSARVSPALRLLGAEAEMWLHDHAVNRAREARGELPVNALWFWGTASVAKSDSSHGRSVVPPGVAHGDDPFLLGLWNGLGGEVGPPLGDYGLLRPASACVVTSAAPRQGEGLTLQQLETAWFEPALEALETRRMPSFRLRLGDHCWDIRRQGISRWWRRPQPWWERLVP